MFRVAHWVTAIVLVMAGGAAIASAQEDTGAQRALRDLWRPGESRFVRTWQVVAAPNSATDQAELERASGDWSALTNLATEQVGGLQWSSVTAWGDIIDIAGALGLPIYRGSAARPETAYAFATLERPHAGEALLSLSADGTTEVWVNGERVHQRGSRPFAFDGDRIPVRFRRGDNAVLVKIGHTSGPWRFSLRVLEPGARLAPREEIAPHLREASGGLLVSAESSGGAGAAPVRILAIGAGGRELADRIVPRGRDFFLDTSTWLDGAYEIRYLTETDIGESRVYHLPWYKGDVLVAARRLVEAAETQTDGVRAAHLRLLADLVHDRLPENWEDAPDDVWPAIHAPLMEYEELLLAWAGSDGPMRPHGFVRLAWMDEVDGSVQFCRAYLPGDYTGARPTPLVLNLHGFNPPNPPMVRWWGVDQRHDAISGRRNVIWVEAHGRGNAQYVGIGEQDVLRCLQETIRRLNVDEERVYLTGESMGGSGTWLIASRHPQLFAAAAPVFGGWDYRVSAGPAPNFNNPRADRRPERFQQEAHASFANAESLFNLPILVHHGDEDMAVGVDHSRHAVRMLQRWGYNIRYVELPGWGHEDLNVREFIVDWMLKHERVRDPRQVRIRSLDLRGASAYWASVRGWTAPLEPIAVDAEILAPGLIRLDTQNVESIRLAPPQWARDGSNSIRVVWNGIERAWPVSDAGEVELMTSPRRRGVFAKSPDMEGRLSNVVTTPFIIVIGTISSDSEMRRLIRERAEAFAANWERWQHVRPRIILDTELTQYESSRHSLLLIGGADANAVTRTIGPRLPLRVTPHNVVIDGRSIPATDAVVQMIYPNPSQPERYVVVVASTSTAGMYFWNSAGFWNQIFGFHTLPFDWTIQDGRRVSLESGMGPERGWIGAGVFNMDWRRDDRWVFLGDVDLRVQSPLRRAPQPGFEPPSGLLDAYAGRYQLYPGVVFEVERTSAGLSLADGSGTPQTLIAESDFEFSVASSAMSVWFRTGHGGEVAELVLNNSGTEVVAVRVP